MSEANRNHSTHPEQQNEHNPQSKKNENAINPLHTTSNSGTNELKQPVNSEAVNSMASQGVKEAAGKATQGVATAIEATTGIPAEKIRKGLDYIKKAKDATDKAKEIKAKREAQEENNNSGFFMALIPTVLILLFVLFPSIMGALTPASILSVFTYQLKADDTTTTVATDDDYDFWTWLSRFIENSAISIFGNEEIDGEDSYTIGTYDSNAEFDDSLEENLKLAKRAMKLAYKEAVKEAKEYCKANGYSWFKAKRTLNDTNSGSWEDVYCEVNYADLMAILNLANNNNDFSAFNSEVFAEILQDENTLKNMYSIEYSYSGKEQENEELTEEQRLAYEEALAEYELALEMGQDAVKPTEEDFSSSGSEISITIHPYTLYSLYNIFGSSPNELYVGNITCYDAQEVQIQQIKAIADETIIAKLGLEYKTPVSYIIDTDTMGSIMDSSSLAGINGTNQEIVWQALKQAGFTDAGAAGLMGNIMAESGFSTAMSGDQGSVGICQWLKTRREQLIAYANSQNEDVTSIYVQTAFLIYSDFPSQMKSRSINGTTSYNFVVNATSYIDACDVVCAQFERPSNYSSKEAWQNAGSKYAWSRYGYSEIFKKYYIDLNKRRSYAKAFYETYAGH